MHAHEGRSSSERKSPLEAPIDDQHCMSSAHTSLLNYGWVARVLSQRVPYVRCQRFAVRWAMLGDADAPRGNPNVGCSTVVRSFLSVI